jgi:ABC-2 type transport system permease protein
MVEPPNGQRLRDYATQVLAVAGADVTKLRHDPTELLTRAVQPVLWLLLFGEVMAQVRGLSTGDLHYLDFLSAGILAQSVLFVAIFYGISAIWERDPVCYTVTSLVRHRGPRSSLARRSRRRCEGFLKP